MSGQTQTLIKKSALTQADVAYARSYIDNFWVNLMRYHPHDEDTLIGLPKPYLVPAHDPHSSFNFDEMYYWDNYFMVQGLLSKPVYKNLVMGILENMFTLLRRYKIIPNASRTYLMGRSQPPLLTSLIFDVYDNYNLDKRWLDQAIEYAKTEYEIVWMGTKKPHWRQVHEGLSRYYDINMLNDLAETESGWDMTPRFNRQCLDYLPIDLNNLLYKYEVDFGRAAGILNQLDEQVLWENKAHERKKVINKLMWHEKTALFYDYNFKTQQRGAVASLAAYTSLWSGLATKAQAKLLVHNLERFEMAGGLAATEFTRTKRLTPGTVAAQWAHPNGWAPLHFLAIQGLKNYGYENDAKRIALKWLETNLDWFNEHGHFLEKYNVEVPKDPPVDGLYPTQIGFGWTNAIFERFCIDFID